VQLRARPPLRILLSDGGRPKYRGRLVRLAIRPEDYQRARARLDDWTTTHDIEHAISSRPSYAAGAASMRTDERDAFVVAGAVTDTIENLSDRLNTYAAQLPKLARWQAELLILDLGGRHDLESALGDIQGWVRRPAAPTTCWAMCPDS
jgi:hypothetical protein